MADSSSGSGTKVAVAAGGGGLGIGLLATLGVHSMLFVAIIVGGILVVGALLLGYFFAIKTLDKRRSAAGDAAIEDDSRRRLQKVNDPEQVAKIAELGRQFEEGVKKYRQATGQRLSEASWYVFTGTPGSGKTEAIRHCGIQMPEGLHKEQQGAGGTVNMDWWFTEEGIILDTAGRYLSDNSSSGEWERFLKLLNKARPDCPINGMLIALPADSLQKDTTEEVQQKATEISRFLDRARSALGVRFPVFVVITKSDLIPGFREFFAHINDPELQAQMVGWSKPGGLDEPFEPDDVEEYLKTLRNTLLKRRVNLLSDPICDADPDGRRLNELDALYLFPDSLMEIAPRLKRYLQGVFVKSKFNQTPLFLRGIYFTSAFEEGAALDSTLARIRGVSLEELEAEGRTWKRERALFLRELFEKKVFKENGLVTRASNTQSLQRARKMTLLGAGFAAVLLLGCFTWFSYKHLANDIGPESDFWSAASKSGNYDNLKMTDASSAFIGNAKQKVGDVDRPPVDFFTTMKPGPTLRPVTEAIPVPALFRPIMPVTNTKFNPLRQATFRVLFDKYVLVPLVKQTRDKLKAEATKKDATYWTEDGSATLALAELLKIECMNSISTPTQSVQLKPFFRFLFPGSNLDDTVAALQKTLDSIYDNSGKPKIGDDTDKTMLAHRCGSDMDTVNLSVDACIASLQQQWFGYEPYKDPKKMLSGLQTLDFEVNAVNIPATPKTEEEYNASTAQLRGELDKTQTVVIPNAATIPNWHPGDHLADVFQHRNEEQKAIAVRTWHVLSDAIANANSSTAAATDAPQPLKGVIAKLAAATTPSAEVTRQYNQDVAAAQAVDNGINTLVPDPAEAASVGQPGTAIQASAVEGGQAMVPAYMLIRSEFKDASSALPDLKQADLDKWKESAKKLETEVNAMPPTPAGAPAGVMRNTIAKLLAIDAQVIRPALKYKQIKQTIDVLASSNEDIKSKVKTSEATPVPAPALMMVATNATLKEFTPDAVMGMLKNVNAIHQEIDVAPEPLQKASLITALADREDALRIYLQDYTRYWSVDVEKAFCNPTAKSWSEFCATLKNDAPNAGRINDKLLALRLAQQQALKLSGATDLKALPIKIVQALKDTSDTSVRACKELDILDARINPNANKVFDDDCNNTLAAWTELCNDSVADAAAAIRQMTPADFKKTYIAHTAGSDGAKYWQNLYEKAIHLLADDYEASANGNLQKFQSTYKSSYPLTMMDDSNPKVLTAQDAADAIKSLDALLGAKVEEKAKSAGDLGNELDRQLDRIYHLHGLTEEDRKKFDNDRKLLKVLIDPAATCTLSFIHHKDPAVAALDRSFVGSLHPEPISQYVTVCCDANNDWAGYRLNAGANNTGAHRQVSFPASAHQLWFLFSSNDAVANKNNLPPTVDASWTVLRMIQEGHGIADPKSNGLVWFVEVPQAPAPNDNNRVLVRVEFSSLGNGEEMPDHPWW